MIMKTLRIHAGTALLAVVCLLAGGCHPAVRPPASSAEDPLAALRNNLPRIDGSTSTIPLDAGIRATLLGISQEEAEKQVAHSTTYGSFQKLLEGTCDVILSTPLSAEQEQAAREAGVTLELTPIAREAFVFAVNAKNPVTGLTQQQLKDIYAGKITSWKAVGGADRPIIAYQRNADSGSQNYMTAFMGDTPLIKPPADRIPGSMGMLMDAIALYNNAEDALGYSVYSYAADMYQSEGKVRFLAVDGVAPDKAAMAEGRYPLMGEYYAISNKSQPEGSTVPQLLKWLVGGEGQAAVARAGYVPINGQAPADAAPVPLLTGVGTGPAKPAGLKRPVAVYETDALLRVTLPDGAGAAPPDTLTLTKGVTFAIEGLKDKALQEEINRFIGEALKQYDTRQAAFEAFLKQEGAEHYEVRLDNSGVAPVAQARAKCVNGYLSVAVGLFYATNSMEGFPCLFEGETRVYDLYTGKTLGLSDLFYQGADYPAWLADRLRRELQTEPSWGSDYTKRPFEGVPAGLSTFGADEILFPRNNLVLNEGRILSFGRPWDLAVTAAARDMKGLFEDTVPISRRFDVETDRQPSAYLLNKEHGVMLLDEQAYAGTAAAAINAAALRDIQRMADPKTAAAALKAAGISYQSLEVYPTYDVLVAGGRYVRYYPTMLEHLMYGRADGVTDSFPDYLAECLYDLQTGRRLTAADLLLDGWEKEAEWRDVFKEREGDDACGAPAWKNLVLTEASHLSYYTAGYPVRIGFGPEGAGYTRYEATVPASYIRW